MSVILALFGGGDFLAAFCEGWCLESSSLCLRGGRFGFEGMAVFVNAVDFVVLCGGFYQDNKG